MAIALHRAKPILNTVSYKCHLGVESVIVVYDIGAAVLKCVAAGDHHFPVDEVQDAMTSTDSSHHRSWHWEALRVLSLDGINAC